MESITKRKLEKDQIERLVRFAFKDRYEVEQMTELTDGYFNNSYLIQLSSGKKVVLKISPKDDVKVLRYEKNLMKAEVSVLNLIAEKGDVPVPKVLFYDDGRMLIDSDYFFMEYMEGIPLNKVKDSMTEEHLQNVGSDLGKYGRKIQNIKGDYFGFINIENRRYDQWYKCFEMMILDLMDDAESENVNLPVTKKQALCIVEKNQSNLGFVDSPSLLHKDLWDGNIFVDPVSYAIKGIIDCERAIYGDPLLESVCGFLDGNEFFMSQYIGKKILNESEQIRIKLYKFYLFLLMVIECPYRQYNDPNFESWARNELSKIVDELKG
ncbi:MAG: aminoglycoside phosphotransferase [Firmicutes bacterium HGW-Firmicutes-20]|jgi:aminoglycoside phosphotransferase (APT) family kinase protein|nr:MAG: aminoglycoside phosphotransferase [Firmicutes bacterium HGW-Firmicutes-20]PKM69986.1 MAG: aminoglycoside phosphotransferase [Firmicutes bacterium HGW-Firmicutes-19]